VQIEHRKFTLPDGFTIEKVAASPLVDRPITGTFDDQGRLYLADSSGSNDKVEVQLAQKPHRIVRLEDTDGDGKFDKSIVFADRMMFPEGTLWYRGSLYVSAPPSIWKLTDTDGDGIADQRSEWFQGKTLTGCANDLHGPYLGRDGRIYWAKGAFAEQNYTIHGRPWKSSAAHFFRSTDNGQELEPVMTGGMDNPVDMVFTPGGERIFSTTFLIQPSVGQRDGLIHAVYGGIYGKSNGKTLEPQHRWTGPDYMPVLSHLGPAAACGLTDYESAQFGPDYRNNVFSSSFNLRTITRHELTGTTAAGLSSKDSDFVVCDDIDFHPTDVFTDADGSLIIVDTGGWYKLCCPTSQIIKADVLGSVYRVRKLGTTPIADPRGLKLDWQSAIPATLVQRLDDPRFAVRDHAIDALARLGNPATPALKAVLQSPSTSANHRLYAVWTACRIGSAEALALVRNALADADFTVRQAASHSAGLQRDAKALEKLVAMLGSNQEPAAVKRAVAEALGRIGKPEAVRPIVAAAASTGNDRVLRHSLTYALIEIESAAGLFEALKSEQNPLARMVAIVALDQMGVMDLPVPELIRSMDSADEATRTLASWVISRHPEWAPQLVASLKAKLAQPPDDKDQVTALTDRLARFASRSAEVQSLLAESLENGSPAARSIAAKAMAGSGLKPCPPAWETALLKVVKSAPADDLPVVLEVYKSLATAGKPATDARFEALVARSQDQLLKAETQWATLTAMPPGVGPLDDALFTRVTSQINPALPSMTRLSAVDLLTRVKLSPAQKRTIAGMISSTGPMESQKLIALFENLTDPPTAETLLAALEKSASLSALREETLKNVVTKLSDQVKDQMGRILDKRNADLVAQRKQVESLLTAFPSGDVRRGQAVFNGAKAACRTCHSVGYVGGKVGPDLSRIGQIRTEKDLLESIVYPSLSFVRSYEPVTVALSDGRVVAGIVQNETPETITVVVNATETRVIPRSEIDDISPSTVSVMPAGLDKQLSTQELADLITYLRASR
jgi:putative membrane-bound dehydrogenase-like protein